MQNERLIFTTDHKTRADKVVFYVVMPIAFLVWFFVPWGVA